MMEWKEVRLGDIYDVHNGLSKGGKFFGSGFPFLTFSVVFNNYFVPEELSSLVQSTEKERLSCSIKAGDVFITRTSETAEELGMSCVALKDYPNATYNGFTKRLRKKDDCQYEVDSRYIGYYLRSRKFRSLFMGLSGSMSTRASLANGDLLNMPVSLPSLSDQRRIASILSSLDKKIETNNKINANLEEMAQAIFKNWFVDFAPFKDGKFVESELGMIPEGWRVGTLTEIIKLLPGGTPKTTEPSFWDNGNIPFFSPKDVTGTYCYDTEKHITESGLNKCSSGLYAKDTIFITCRGTVGKITMSACDMAMNQSNYAIKGIDGYSQYYIFFIMRSIVERLLKKANGAVFSAITTKDFDEAVIIPPLNVIKDFDECIKSTFTKIYTIGKENQHLASIRDTLLPRLMSGEIEV